MTTGARESVQTTSSPVMRAACDQVLESTAGRAGHVFNLGHGIIPQTTPAQVRALVDHVHEASAK